MDLKEKNILRQKRRWRVRKRISGTAECPRMTVCFSNKHVYVQFIDDVAGQTISSFSSVSKEFEAKHHSITTELAREIGKKAGEKAKASGINTVVFDRNYRKYHGKLKALADGARESIKF